MSKKLNEKEKIILKLEITSLFFLIEKVYADWWKKSNHGGFFGGESNISIQDINADIENLLKNLLDFKINLRVKVASSSESITINVWEDFFKKGDWRRWRSINLDSNKENIIQVIFGSCEGLNSGIEKGSPKEHIKGNEPFIANAFGTLKFIPDENFIEELRRIIFNSNNILPDIKNIFGNYNIQIRDKDIPNFNLSHIFEDFKTISSKTEVCSNELDSLRENLYKAFKLLYKFIPSDSRFPINDTSLFDQIYISTSMFKAKLNELLSENSGIELEKVKKHQNFKWRILGIQYDKFGLAEKGLKLASIQWYREITGKIDEEIKKLLELEYPIGNEIYRDETGIYFIVGEDLGKDLNDDVGLAKLKPELKEIKKKIYEIFERETKDEFYPAIFLTKASRGLMNLSYLLENAKSNFLKAKKKKDLNLWLLGTKKGKAIGICPTCQVRLIYESDKEKDNSPTICEVCDERVHHKQVSQWIENISGETIWLDEVKDKNNRVAYISLKFELEDWLNGNLLNSLLVRAERYNDYISKIRIFLILLILNKFDFTSILSDLEAKISELKNKLRDSSLSKDEKKKLGQGKSLVESKKRNLEKIINLLGSLVNTKWWSKPLDKQYSLAGYSNWDIDDYIQEIKKLLTKSGINLEIENPFKELSEDAYNGCKSKKESFDDFIKQVFFSSIIGTQWAEWIKETPSNNKIDWEKEEMKWEEFTDENDPAVDLLAILLLQFLLRKNPSPARLRRIWETTREFFENIHKNLDNILEIPEWRKRRLIWEVELNGSNKLEKSMELEGEGLLFWAEKVNDNKAKIYLISSIRDFLIKFGKTSIKKQIIEGIDDSINKQLENFKDIVEEKHLTLKSLDSQNSIEIITSAFSEIKEYKPFAKITDPSPKNYQIIIPAEYLEKLIDGVIKRYDKEFKYVYGKLPLHIGIIVSHYKKPAYVNLKALRRIRRDVEGIDELYINKKKEEFQQNFEEKLNRFARKEENDNLTKDYYALYWDNPRQQDYNFYIKPADNSKKWISIIDKFPQNANVEIIPNTFDFEFMDTNTRRNDIFYDGTKGYKRAVSDKSNRPYEIEKYWDKFKRFKKIFSNETTSSKLHKLIQLLYEKAVNFDKSYAPFLASSFIRILELNKNKELLSGIKFIFDIQEDVGRTDFHKQFMNKLESKENLLLFIDMFEFWHTMLKEV